MFCCHFLFSYSYFNILNIDEKNPSWEERDRLVLSKGHCSPALYSCLANRGFFEEEKLKDFRKINKKPVSQKYIILLVLIILIQNTLTRQQKEPLNKMKIKFLQMFLKQFVIKR